MDHVFADWFPHSKSITIYSDCMTAICSITGLGKGGDNILRIHRYLTHNTHGHIIHLKWMHGHSGVIGNEAANHLAKSAAISSLPSCYNKFPFSKIKYWNYQIAIQQWQEEWNSSNTGRLTFDFIPSITRRLEWKHFSPFFAMIQLLTGHGNFRAYLKRFRIRDDDVCTCDNSSVQDSKHFLFNSSLVDSKRNNLLGSVLHAGYNWLCPLKVLIENKDIYHNLSDFLLATKALNPSRDPPNTDDERDTA
ncbi:uncharacterized protein [Centruroides vittatus]|uniref:uncharacterized protein n=1 Tax=Centruroides vittatus TaxID=120091 RepID=UPI003510BADE